MSHKVNAGSPSLSVAEGSLGLMLGVGVAIVVVGLIVPVGGTSLVSVGTCALVNYTTA